MATTPRATGDSHSSLRSLRRRVEALAVPDGAFVVVADDEAVRPVPVAGLRFESASAAREAARLTDAYRRALRRYDPRLPRYDLGVEQSTAIGSQNAAAASGDADSR